jgi:hypothetical protein
MGGSGAAGGGGLSGFSAEAGAIGSSGSSGSFTGVGVAGRGSSTATGAVGSAAGAEGASLGAETIACSVSMITAWAEPSAGTQHCRGSDSTVTIDSQGWHVTTRQRGRQRLRNNRQAEAESIDRTTVKAPTTSTRNQRRTSHLCLGMETTTSCSTLRHRRFVC